MSSAPLSRAELAGAIAPELLSAEAAGTLPVRGRKKAGVLVALFASNGAALSIVMTRRGDQLRRHAGELSFPGGRVDDDDADLSSTALRESHEEIGLAPRSVELLGALPPTPYSRWGDGPILLLLAGLALVLARRGLKTR